QVQFVYRIAREEALLIAQEVIVHSLGEQARTVRGVVVTGVRGEGFPVETLAERTAQARGDVPGALIIKRRGSLVAAQFEGVEHTLQLQQIPVVGVEEDAQLAVALGAQEHVSGGAPELGATTRFGVSGVRREAAERLHAIVEIVSTLGVGRVEAAAIPDAARTALGVRATPFAASSALAWLVAECGALLGREFEQVVACRTGDTGGTQCHQRQG